MVPESLWPPSTTNCSALMCGLVDGDECENRAKNERPRESRSMGGRTIHARRNDAQLDTRAEPTVGCGAVVGLAFARTLAGRDAGSDERLSRRTIFPSRPAAMSVSATDHRQLRRSSSTLAVVVLVVIAIPLALELRHSVQRRVNQVLERTSRRRRGRIVRNTDRGQPRTSATSRRRYAATSTSSTRRCTTRTSACSRRWR